MKTSPGMSGLVMQADREEEMLTKREQEKAQVLSNLF